MKHVLVAATLSILATAANAQQVPGQHFVENWDLNEDGQVTLAEARERRGDVFLTFDSDEDGFLSAAEYVFFDQARANDMAENGEAHGNGPMKRADGGMTMAFNDVDQDGRVSRDEFLSRVADWMALMDNNGDGAISTDDFGKGKNKRS